MQFVLTAFRQDGNVRLYNFDGISADRTRSAFSVAVDLVLMRKHQIPMQEIPFLCRCLLENQTEGQDSTSFTFGEREMSAYANKRAIARDEAEQKKKTHRRPPGAPQGGNAWRGVAPSVPK